MPYAICWYINFIIKPQKRPLLGLLNIFFFKLQLHYSTIINLWWYYSNVLKPNNIFLFPPTNICLFLSLHCLIVSLFLSWQNMASLSHISLTVVVFSWRGFSVGLVLLAVWSCDGHAQAHLRWWVTQPLLRWWAAQPCRPMMGFLTSLTDNGLNLVDYWILGYLFEVYDFFLLCF